MVLPLLHMRGVLGAVSLSCCLITLPAQAQLLLPLPEYPAKQVRISPQFLYEGIENMQDEQQFNLRVSAKLGLMTVLSGNFEHHERAHISDDRFGIGLMQVVNPRTTLIGVAQFTPAAEAVAEQTYTAVVVRNFTQRWLGTGVLLYSTYPGPVAMSLKVVAPSLTYSASRQLSLTGLYMASQVSDDIMHTAMLQLNLLPRAGVELFGNAGYGSEHLRTRTQGDVARAGRMVSATAGGTWRMRGGRTLSISYLYEDRKLYVPVHTITTTLGFEL